MQHGSLCSMSSLIESLAQIMKNLQVAVTVSPHFEEK